jgi:hypothetical protein
MYYAVRRLTNTVDGRYGFKREGWFLTGHCKAVGGDAHQVHSREKTLQSATNDSAINQ